MASIYTSRQLLDPNWLAKANAMEQQEYQQRLNSLGETANWFRDWRNRKAEQAKLKNDMNTRAALLGDYGKQGPVEAAVANRFIETGDYSGILNVENNKTLAQARIDDAKTRAEEALSTARPKFIELKNKYEQQFADGDFTGAEATKAYMQAMEEKTPGLMNGVDFDAYEAAKKREAEEKAFAEQDKKTRELAEAKRQENIANRSSELKQFILSLLPEGTIKDIEEKNEYLDMIDSYAQTGLLTEEDKKELQNYVQGVKTTKQQISESIASSIANYYAEQYEKLLDERITRKEAQQYNGKKLNSLEWNAIDEKVRKFLNRDGSGNVTMKKIKG